MSEKSHSVAIGAFVAGAVLIAIAAILFAYASMDSLVSGINHSKI